MLLVICFIDKVTNHYLSDEGSFRSPRCVRYDYEKEDRDHTIRCNKSDEWFHEFTEELTETMRKLSTDPTLMTMLVRGTKAWRNHIPFDVTNLEPCHRELIHEQDNIGWRQIFNGRWSKK